jgi:hypothetical protein
LNVANPAARADLPPAQDFAGKEIPPEHTDAIRQALIELAPLDPLRRERDLSSSASSTSRSARDFGSASSAPSAGSTSTATGG